MSGYGDRQEFMNGKIVLYTRNGNPTFHARIVVDGLPKPIVKTTRRKNLLEALAVAEDLYNDYRYKVRHGQEVGTHTFATLYKRFIESHRSGLSHYRITFIEGTARRYFLPYFGRYNVAQITDALIERYWDWRRNFWNSEAGRNRLEEALRARPTKANPHKSRLGNVSRSPAPKTLMMEQTVLKQIFHWGVRTGAMTKMPHVKVPLQKRHGVSRRPAFSMEEWQALYRYLRSWVGEGNEGTIVPEPKRINASHLYHRRVLRNYVLFMQASGLRPNEARQLRWRDMKIQKDKNKEDQLVLSISPSTKTGARQCIALRYALEVVERMKRQHAHTQADDFVFCDLEGKPIANFGKTFKTVLRDAGLLKDSFGQERTIYSLRHTYATMRIGNSDISLHDLAQNMGTSPATIFAHYSHVTPSQKAHIHGGTLHKDLSRKGWYL